MPSDMMSLNVRKLVVSINELFTTSLTHERRLHIVSICMII